MTRQPLLGAPAGVVPAVVRVLAVLAALTLAVGCSTADAKDTQDAVASYESALAPLKKRSDVLEERFAAAQGEDYTGPEQVREVLVEIIPEYAELLEETRDIEVEGRALEEAHEALIQSLELQQSGLEMALRGMEEGDAAEVARAGRALEKAQALVEEHRALLADARS